jgi:DEAD/DEAH box helicase domain-containing protein
MVASSAPLDQFVVRHPAYFFDRSPERALIDPDNLHILVDHIKCAAFELPFTPGEEFGRHDLQEILAVLAEQGLVHRSGASADPDQPDASQWTWTSESYPADAVSLRSVSSDNFVIVDTTHESRVIGETDFTSGPATLHPKAIYIVEAALYQVERLDFEGRKAFVREIDCDYYTSAITYSQVTVLDTFESDDSSDHNLPRAGGGAPRACGEVHVVSRVVGFKKIKFYTNENVGSGDLDLPEQQMHTTAYWLTIPSGVMEALPYAADDRRDGVVGLSFALGQVAQLLLMCERHDIGISIDAGDPVGIFIYDNYPGGIGFSGPLFRMHEELLEGTRRLIAECDCENGCPGCVGPIGNTGPLAKSAALRILNLLTAAALALAEERSQVQAS